MNEIDELTEDIDIDIIEDLLNENLLEYPRELSPCQIKFVARRAN